MEVYETEEQQVEAIRAWFKKRAKLLLITALLIASVVLGVQYWKHHMHVQQEAASLIYQGMIAAIEKQDPISANAKAKLLSTEYDTSIYSSIAQLYLAKIAVQNNKLDEAKPYLESVIKNNRAAGFQDIARLRLAKIFFTQKKNKEALALLDHNVALLQELKADILISEDKSKEAQALYQLAQESISKKDINHPLLKMKLEALGDI